MITTRSCEESLCYFGFVCCNWFLYRSTIVWREKISLLLSVPFKMCDYLLGLKVYYYTEMHLYKEVCSLQCWNVSFSVWGLKLLIHLAMWNNVKAVYIFVHKAFYITTVSMLEHLFVHNKLPPIWMIVLLSSIIST